MACVDACNSSAALGGGALTHLAVGAAAVVLPLAPAEAGRLAPGAAAEPAVVAAAAALGAPLEADPEDGGGKLVYLAW